MDLINNYEAPNGIKIMATFDLEIVFHGRV